MKKRALIVAGTSMIALSGCASVIEGTSQEITINTNPAGANCSLERQNVSIGRISPTPGAVTVKKTKYDITVVCEKSGYQRATFFNKSGTPPASFGNILLGGGIGVIVDSASGADNLYTTPVNMTLVPDEAPKSP
jgi:hypothetical protein